MIVSCKNSKMMPLKKQSFKTETGSLSIPTGGVVSSSLSDHSIDFSGVGGNTSATSLDLDPALPEAPAVASAEVDSPVVGASAGAAPTLPQTSPVSTGDLKITARGFLEGTNVFHDVKLKHGSYTGGTPKGIILHKTAGKAHSCQEDNTVGNKAPHIYM